MGQEDIRQDDTKQNSGAVKKRFCSTPQSPLRNNCCV